MALNINTSIRYLDETFKKMEEKRIQIQENKKFSPNNPNDPSGEVVVGRAEQQISGLEANVKSLEKAAGIADVAARSLTITMEAMGDAKKTIYNIQDAMIFGSQADAAPYTQALEADLNKILEVRDNTKFNNRSILDGSLEAKELQISSEIFADPKQQVSGSIVNGIATPAPLAGGGNYIDINGNLRLALVTPPPPPNTYNLSGPTGTITIDGSSLSGLPTTATTISTLTLTYLPTGVTTPTTFTLNIQLRNTTDAPDYSSGNLLIGTNGKTADQVATDINTQLNNIISTVGSDLNLAGVTATASGNTITLGQARTAVSLDAGAVAVTPNQTITTTSHPNYISSPPLNLSAPYTLIPTHADREVALGYSAKSNVITPSFNKSNYGTGAGQLATVLTARGFTTAATATNLATLTINTAQQANQSIEIQAFNGASANAIALYDAGGVEITGTSPDLTRVASIRVNVGHATMANYDAFLTGISDQLQAIANTAGTSLNSAGAKFSVNGDALELHQDIGNTFLTQNQINKSAANTSINWTGNNTLAAFTSGVIASTSATYTQNGRSQVTLIASDPSSAATAVKSYLDAKNFDSLSAETQKILSKLSAEIATPGVMNIKTADSGNTLTVSTKAGTTVQTLLANFEKSFAVGSLYGSNASYQGTIGSELLDNATGAQAAGEIDNIVEQIRTAIGNSTFGVGAKFTLGGNTFTLVNNNPQEQDVLIARRKNGLVEEIDIEKTIANLIQRINDSSDPKLADFNAEITERGSLKLSISGKSDKYNDLTFNFVAPDGVTVVGTVGTIAGGKRASIDLTNLHDSNFLGKLSGAEIVATPEKDTVKVSITLGGSTYTGSVPLKNNTVNSTVIFTKTGKGPDSSFSLTFKAKDFTSINTAEAANRFGTDLAKDLANIEVSQTREIQPAEKDIANNIYLTKGTSIHFAASDFSKVRFNSVEVKAAPNGQAAEITVQSTNGTIYSAPRGDNGLNTIRAGQRLTLFPIDPKTGNQLSNEGISIMVPQNVDLTSATAAKDFQLELSEVLNVNKGAREIAGLAFSIPGLDDIVDKYYRPAIEATKAGDFDKALELMDSGYQEAARRTQSLRSQQKGFEVAKETIGRSIDITKQLIDMIQKLPSKEAAIQELKEREADGTTTINLMGLFSQMQKRMREAQLALMAS